MKKNKALTAALSVFALTMMSMCAIGGTFAKYVTTRSGSDTARVAKWGVDVSVTADSAIQVTDSNGTTESDIISGTAAESVIAPGSKGKLLDVVITGEPEVSVYVKHTATLTLGNNWMVPSGIADDPATLKDESVKFYCPIVFTIRDGVYINGFNYNDAESLSNAVVNAITNITEDVDFDNTTDFVQVTNTTNLANTYDLHISWEWPFTAGGNDKDDTALGNNAAAGNIPTFEIEVDTEVGQVN